jgi:hypothetical protein
MNKIILTFAVIFLFLSSSSFSQTDELITSTLTAQIGGNGFRSALKTFKTETSYEINAGNENEGIKILWNNINSESQVKTGTSDFPSVKDILIGYVDYKIGKPFAVKSGTLTVTENDGKKITGTFSFTVFDGMPAELGGKEIIITNGKFTVHY